MSNGFSHSSLQRSSDSSADSKAASIVRTTSAQRESR